jgi:hypothetical protein
MQATCVDDCVADPDAGIAPDRPMSMVLPSCPCPAYRVSHRRAMPRWTPYAAPDLTDSAPQLSIIVEKELPRAADAEVFLMVRYTLA